jgi:hypothetical protein
VRGAASDGRPGWHVGPRVRHGLRVTGGPEAEMDFGFSFNPIFHKHRNDSLAGKKLLGVSKKSENFPGVTDYLEQLSLLALIQISMDF